MFAFVQFMIMMTLHKKRIKLVNRNNSFKECYGGFLWFGVS